MLELEETTRDKLEKYATPRTTSVPMIVDAVAQTFNQRAARAWQANPLLIPVLKKTPEAKTVAVRVRAQVEKNFLYWCNHFSLDPVSLLTWLVNVYIKKFNLERLAAYKDGKRPWKQGSLDYPAAQKTKPL